MNKEKRIIDFYVLTNKLKNVVRTGWLNWHVNSDRVESVAEHVYGVQMLALAMYAEYQYDLDIKKVIFMLAIHELEETIIGDLTFKQISSEDKKIIGHEAVEKILSGLLSGEK
jgi:putative hydrolase of HD superfamily